MAFRSGKPVPIGKREGHFFYLDAMQDYGVLLSQRLGQVSGRPVLPMWSPYFYLCGVPLSQRLGQWSEARTIHELVAEGAISLSFCTFCSCLYARFSYVGTFGNKPRLGSQNCSGVCPFPGSYSSAYSTECTLVDVGYTAVLNKAGLADGYEKCQKDDETTADRGSGFCICDQGYYRVEEGKRSGECSTCPDNARCDFTQAVVDTAPVLVSSIATPRRVVERTLATIVVLPKYWRATNSTSNLRRCVARPDYCVGTSSGFNGTICKAFHTGAFCMNCIAGFAVKDVVDGCTLCDDDIEGDRNIFLAQMMGFVTGLIVVTLGLFISRRKHFRDMFTKSADSKEEVEMAANKSCFAACFSKRKGAILKSMFMLKIIIGFFQVSTSVNAHILSQTYLFV